MLDAASAENFESQANSMDFARFCQWNFLSDVKNSIFSLKKCAEAVLETGRFLLDLSTDVF